MFPTTQIQILKQIEDSFKTNMNNYKKRRTSEEIQNNRTKPLHISKHIYNFHPHRAASMFSYDLHINLHSIIL